MKLAQSVFLTILGLLTLPLGARSAPPATAAPNTSGRVVRVQADVNAPMSEVWRVFTTSQGAEKFFAQKANIVLAIGGPTRSNSIRKTSAPAPRD